MQDYLNYLSNIIKLVDQQDLDLQSFSVLDIDDTDKIFLYLYMKLKILQNLNLFYEYILPLRMTLSKHLLITFFCDYLTIFNNGIIVKPSELVSSFFNFYETQLQKVKNQDILKQLLKYATYYKKIVNSSLGFEKIDKLLLEINNLNSTEAYPLLMQLCEDFEYALINQEMFIDSLNMIISFIKYQNSSSSSGLVTDFNSLGSEINKILFLKDYSAKIIHTTTEDLILNIS